MCDQEPETLNHVLIQCVFARVVWHQVFGALGRPELTPEASDTVVEWCNACAQRAPSKKEAKDIRTMASLVLWELWKHRNAIVFEGATPSTTVLIARVECEARAWSTAGLLKGNLSSFLLM